MAAEKILMVHNYYQQPGGEDESFRAEMSMLKSMGHEVFTYTRSNDQIKVGGLKNKAGLFLHTVWAQDSYRDITQAIRQHKPDLVHFQNIFPLISPSVYYACRKENVPVVQSLRTYRLICSNGFLFREGKVCEDCMGRFVPLPAVVHACYHNSRLQSFAVASMLIFHRTMRTWESQVDRYIALTEFSRAKFIEAGLSPEKIVIKPNYIPDPGAGSYPGSYAVFVGRLSPEKGIETLLNAWKLHPEIPLKIVGKGPLSEFVVEFIQKYQLNIQLIGYLPNQQVMNVIKGSAFFIFPSIWYETFGRTIVEAFACGKPVIASRLGTSLELVKEGQTGRLFHPGDAGDLAEKVSDLWESVEKRIRLGKNARLVYETEFTLAKNYDRLYEIYRQVMKRRS